MQGGTSINIVVALFESTHSLEQEQTVIAF